ncbi:MAG: hypothetical protein AAF493_15225 [Pseudomonadota bacterium]
MIGLLLKLRGPMGIWAVLGALVVGGAQYALANKDLDHRLIPLLKQRVGNEFAEYYRDRYASDPDTLAAMEKAARDIQFHDVAVRGNTKSVVVRVEVGDNVAKPPTYESVRYYEFERGVGDWHFPDRVSRWAYTLAFL